MTILLMCGVVLYLLAVILFFIGLPALIFGREKLGWASLKTSAVCGVLVSIMAFSAMIYIVVTT